MKRKSLSPRKTSSLRKPLPIGIWQAGLRLSETPHIGRLGVEPDTRHWVVQRTPYLIVYRVQDETLEILRVWHGRSDWMHRDD